MIFSHWGCQVCLLEAMILGWFFHKVTDKYWSLQAAVLAAVVGVAVFWLEVRPVACSLHPLLFQPYAKQTRVIFQIKIA